MKKKGFLLCVTLICVSFLLISCAKNPTPAATDNTAKSEQKENSNAAGSKKNIALVMKTLTNPFFIEMEKGARKAENELGINLIVKTGAKETSIDQQIAIVEELINAKVDAIVIAPGSSTDLIPVLKKAQDAKIQIVNIDNRLDPKTMKNIGLLDVPFISVDNEAGAYQSAKYISDKITKPTKVAILEGIRSADNAEQRKKGALRAFKENKNIQVVAMETANWKIDEAYNVTSEIFSKNPDIGAIFCANDMMALGAIQYLDSVKKKNVLVAGFDALEEALRAIKTGRMQVTINQQADVQGYNGIKFAFAMLNGEKQAPETYVPMKVITSSALNQ
ncbi:MAG: sugar ABC transporter substrate-binding protein [Peptococcaceae bacterium]|nr:sugar ABC transporter substrate-binding protein [Peptococcaceae bacterium]